MLIALVLTPLVYPPIPPLEDLPGHIGTYKIELDLFRSPYLSRWYEFHWRPIGNLGVELLMKGLGPLLGVEPATKLVVIATVLLTAAAFLWILAEVHEQIPPTAPFVLALVYCYPFQYGFINFCLSVALALLSFALWLHLGRRDRKQLRALLFVPLSCVVFLAHIVGWGILGVLCFSAELAERLPQGFRCRTDVQETWRASLACLPLTPPLILLATWRSHSSGETFGWLDFGAKLKWSVAILRDRWRTFDLGSAAVLYGLIAAGLVWKEKVRLNSVLGIGALGLAAAVLILPTTIFGSKYASVRIAPYAVALGLLALRPGPALSMRGQQLLAIASLCFLAARVIGTTISLGTYSKVYTTELAAIDHVSPGSRVLTLVDTPCIRRPWAHARLSHLGSLAIARKEAFSNDQWATEGAQLVQVSYPAAGEFQSDPSETVTSEPRCPWAWKPAEKAIRMFPRQAFDFLWLIDVPHRLWPRERDLVRVWSSKRSVLYRLSAVRPGSETFRQQTKQ